MVHTRTWYSTKYLKNLNYTVATLFAFSELMIKCSYFIVRVMWNIQQMFHDDASSKIIPQFDL